MEAQAEARKVGAEVCDLIHLKEVTITLGDIRQKRNPEGKVYRIVRLLKCHAKMDQGVGNFDLESEMESGANFGPLGEIDQCLSPALKEFVTKLARAVMDHAKEAAKPLDPDAPLPLPSEQAKDQLKSMTMQKNNAAREVAKKKAAAETPAPDETPATPEGGEA
jgi:hypothetical protein